MVLAVWVILVVQITLEIKMVMDIQITLEMYLISKSVIILKILRALELNSIRKLPLNQRELEIIYL